jgi:murein DD-endopeptidase MepM/ murein hydrolase activator NlpD
VIISHRAPAVRVRSFRVPRFAILLAVVIFCAGLGGLGRLVFVGGRYGLARVGVIHARREHASLLNKVRFLGKLSEHEKKRLEHLAWFEDVLRLKYGMSTVSDEVRRAGVGGKPDAEQVVASLLGGPMVRIADSVRAEAAALLRRATLQTTTLSQVAEHALRQSASWDQRPSTWPTRGRITSGFGQRIHPLTLYPHRHEGIDIANAEWTVILAPADGIVSYVGRKQYYGITVYIDHHGNGYTTRYAHLVQSAVGEGDVVRRGDIVGYMGNTGRSTGPHLHYEVRVMGKPVDPLSVIVPTDVVVD